ncbi:succinate dehydrogenase assembly factor 2 [Moraxella sp. FZLJ2107]|uniref:FAD assembly factor SdhE n=1 Tax=unclassified Moraxella TaxID=2685852 RepID=UPI00209C14C0|nr:MULTISPECIES: succinate dehydrogenase assembly factor 2 [unclassified Moraxella]USZ14597.1 succinate dehydrogenase assembly factor 2 [Moraxella sp. FZFQ2102]UTO05278.1 succinate dehydrogenase assembly factor 2 [Moraxella sp. FZLJ2107]UTO22013.1 succinate dehydrogenase assembly factor 2 [Moraxella sp. FZLJ2109]
MSITPTDHQRRIIYQARRGLKELDYYIDPYVKTTYLTADSDEQAAFETMLTYEDPDLLLFFMDQAKPAETAVAELIAKMKQLKHGA